MKKIDFPLLGAVVFLTLFGLLMIYNASSFIAFRDFGDKYHYIRDQVIWVFLGFFSLTFFTFFDYKRLYVLAMPALLVATLLLLAVFVPGLSIEALGARRWINAGFFVIQPAEFVKLALAIYLSAWFSQKQKERLRSFLFIMGVVFSLIMLEPDMGTASIVLFEAMVAYFLSGGKIQHFLLLIPTIGLAALGFIALAPYRAARLGSFLSHRDPLEGASYHVKQILIALGSGGLVGVGLGNSLQKYAYVPESTTDSIFAIIGEELGFVGGVVVIILLFVVIWRGFSIASSGQTAFGRLLAATITAFLGMQMIMNLASQTALMPLTGVPLPFISYGGSSLIVDLCSVGILLSVSRSMKHR